MNYYIQLVNKLLDQFLTLAEQVAVLEQLQIEGLTAQVLAEIAQIFRSRMLPVTKVANNTVDLVGTGGDSSGSFNISTTASFVVAASGVPIAKHGNRSVSSRSGSFDCLEALGVKIPENSTLAEQQLHNHGITFLFAPFFHPSFTSFREARRILSQQGKKSIFNLLGPLLNPANVTRIAIGVYDKSLIKLFIETLQLLNMEKAIVMHGEGLDEFTLTGKTHYAVLDKGKIYYQETLPGQLGFLSCCNQDLLGGDALENAQITREILTNQIQNAKPDMVIINAATAIFVSDEINFPDAIQIAKETLNSGKAVVILEQLRSKYVDIK